VPPSAAPPPAASHSFAARPHRTLVALTLPVLISLVAEPLMGLVDTAFVAQLGAAPLAGLGAAATLLSSVFWIFNFLGIGTQTEVALGAGEGRAGRERDAATLALAMSVAIGAGLALLAWPLLPRAALLMSADPEVGEAMIAYLEVRLLGAPAVLITFAGFGALRGLQDMRTPLWIAAAANAGNAALAPLLIFGAGPVPALGVAGAAWAAVVAQWAGVVWLVAEVRRRIGFAPRVPWSRAPGLLRVGRDLFLRTGLLTLFLLLATRAATRLGAEPGAAHQAVRQVWLLTALVLDAYAAAAQSLVAYFLGAGLRPLARRVAAVACGWSVGTGFALAALMLLGEDAVARLLVPEPARAVFAGAWLALALAQPLNALAFATDGVHWGTGDYRYLRNAMFTATSVGLALLAGWPGSGPDALTRIWIVTLVWVAVRAALGALRVWPGVGAAPLAARRA
jgi:MATE family multidrug resistance protein